MRITTSRSDGAVTVRVHTTRLDAAVADELRRGLAEAIASRMTRVDRSIRVLPPAAL